MDSLNAFGDPVPPGVTPVPRLEHSRPVHYGDGRERAAAKSIEAKADGGQFIRTSLDVKGSKPIYHFRKSVADEKSRLVSRSQGEAPSADLDAIQARHAKHHVGTAVRCWIADSHRCHEALKLVNRQIEPMIEVGTQGNQCLEIRAALYSLPENCVSAEAPD